MKRTLRRIDDGRMIAGVCQGLGEYLNVDPVFLRIGFVLLTIANGLGLPLYVLAWLLIPRADASYASQEELLRQNADEIGQRARELGVKARGAFRESASDDPWAQRSGSRNASMVGAGGVLIGIGVLLLLSRIGLFNWLSPTRILPVALIVTGALLLLRNQRRGWR